MVEDIRVQLNNYCSCIEEINEKDLMELITLVSNITCWEDTFLRGAREEIVSLKGCVDKCGIIKWNPFYKFYDINTFYFELVKIKGIEEEVIKIGEVVFSDIDKCFKIQLPLEQCGCKCNCLCDCKEEYFLKITYEAGLDILPEELLPVFCDMIKLVQRKNDCCCDGTCSCSTQTYTVEEQQSLYKIGDWMGYEHDKELSTLLNGQYRKILGMLSLCDKSPLFFTKSGENKITPSLYNLNGGMYAPYSF